MLQRQLSFISLLLFFLCGCTHKSVRDERQLDYVSERQMIIAVHGIECDECARLAVAKIEAIAGVRSATYVPDDVQDERGSLVIIYSGEISYDVLERALSSEGFKLV